MNLSLEEAIVYIAEHIETILDGFTALWLTGIAGLILIIAETGSSLFACWLTYRLVRKGYKEGKIELRSSDYMSVKELLESERERKGL